MKEINLSFQLRISLKQRDVHWIEDELIRLREEMFFEVLKRILAAIEEEVLKETKSCERCEGGINPVWPGGEED